MCLFQNSFRNYSLPDGYCGVAGEVVIWDVHTPLPSASSNPQHSPCNTAFPLTCLKSQQMIIQIGVSLHHPHGPGWSSSVLGSAKPSSASCGRLDSEPAGESVCHSARQEIKALANVLKLANSLHQVLNAAWCPDSQIPVLPCIREHTGKSHFVIYIELYKRVDMFVDEQQIYVKN